MTTDGVFWIASMTKAVTVAGAMQLVEQGRLQLDDLIGKLLPDLAAGRQQLWAILHDGRKKVVNEGAGDRPIFLP